MTKYSALCLIFILLWACKSQPTAREMSAMEIMGQINNDFCLLIDTRENGTFSKTAEAATWIPATEIEKNQNDLSKILPATAHAKTIVIFSEKPEQSINTCQLFLKQNFKCNYLKHFKEWEEANLPTKAITH
jgi:hypothetical protein